jgi:hypothetical protein
VQIKDIKITGLSITGNQDGSENLYISASFGEGDDEVFYSRTELVRDTVTVLDLQKAINRIAETMGVN